MTTIARNDLHVNTRFRCLSFLDVCPGNSRKTFTLSVEWMFLIGIITCESDSCYHGYRNCIRRHHPSISRILLLWGVHMWRNEPFYKGCGHIHIPIRFSLSPKKEWKYRNCIQVMPVPVMLHVQTLRCRKYKQDCVEFYGDVFYMWTSIQTWISWTSGLVKLPTTMAGTSLIFIVQRYLLVFQTLA